MAAPPNASGNEPRDHYVEDKVDASKPDGLPQDDVSPAHAADPDYSEKDGRSQVIRNARAAAAKEQNMTLLQGIKLYPKAIFWSILISTCIVMEGYDISLVNNFCTSLLTVVDSNVNMLRIYRLFESSIAYS
jgi:SP family general alpha glucoside:H+ symporter-like MFS transporter